MSDKFTGEKTIPLKTKLLDCWISYLGAVTTLLRSRGIKCDLTEVAGMSGYAFIVNIHPELLPTGPVAFDWEVLVEGTQALGIQTELVAVELSDNEAELYQELFLRVREEIDENRCCIIWGAGDGPEFNLVCGYCDDAYVVLKSNGNRLVRYDRLKAIWRLAGVFFGEPVAVERKGAERKAILRAVKLLQGMAPCFDAEYHSGFKAFQTWAELVKAGRADNYGFIYNLMCYYELQMFAAGFCARLASRHQKIAVQLKNAAKFFQWSFENLKQIKDIAPEPDEQFPNPDQISKLLKECAELNSQAVQELERALSLV
jgi:hypothetical protein